MSVRARGVAVVLGVAVALAGVGAGSARASDPQEGALVAVASSYLGLSKARLVAKLRAGMTLARIANATRGKSAAGLVERLIAPVQATLDAKVAKGEITRPQERSLLAKLREWTTRFVRTWTLGGKKHRG